MVLNAKCKDCKESTKYVVGFFDGRNAQGCLYDCHNEDCEIKQIMEVSASKDIQERAKIQIVNGNNGMYAGYIAALRRDAKVTMFKMAQYSGISITNTALAILHTPLRFHPSKYSSHHSFHLNTHARIPFHRNNRS